MRRDGAGPYGAVPDLIEEASLALADNRANDLRRQGTPGNRGADFCGGSRAIVPSS